MGAEDSKRGNKTGASNRRASDPPEAVVVTPRLTATSPREHRLGRTDDVFDHSTKKYGDLVEKLHATLNVFANATHMSNPR